MANDGFELLRQIGVVLLSCLGTDKPSEVLFLGYVTVLVGVEVLEYQLAHLGLVLVKLPQVRDCLDNIQHLVRLPFIPAYKS